MKYVQWISILPPKEVVQEVQYDELPDELKPDRIPKADTIRVSGRAVRGTIVEKDEKKQSK